MMRYLIPILPILAGCAPSTEPTPTWDEITAEPTFWLRFSMVAIMWVVFWSVLLWPRGGKDGDGPS